MNRERTIEEFSEVCSVNQRAAYVPDEDEKTLDYLFRVEMTLDEKLEALGYAWWTATNSGYNDAMANRLMAGEEDAQTRLWEQNCSNKDAIDRYYVWLKEQSGSTEVAEH